jgi:hypothetical protein
VYLKFKKTAYNTGLPKVAGSLQNVLFCFHNLFKCIVDTELLSIATFGKPKNVVPHIMKKTLQILFLLITTSVWGQNKTPKEFGFRHLQVLFQNDTVDILIKSKKGEEKIPKPLFFFCQGSLPVPLIIFEEAGTYGTFPFDPDILTDDYHLVIVSKPYIPLISEAKTLKPDLSYVDNNGNFLKEYSERNFLDYYVLRNSEVINYLQKESWVKTEKLIIAGHSEGSTIAAKIALDNSKITHLIYSGGNPMGRILTSIAQSRTRESASDTISSGNEKINYWKTVVADKENTNATKGDTHKATYQFSIPPLRYLEKVTIPILVTYGTKDFSAPFNDYLQIEAINNNWNNFTFIPLIGKEHNFFPLEFNGKINYKENNWNFVAKHWKEWLTQN